MTTVISCPSCAAPLSITPELIGRLIACPACGQQIQLAEQVLPADASARALKGSTRLAKPAPAAPHRAALSAATRNQGFEKSLSPALLASYGVLAALLGVAGILVWYLATNRQEDNIQAARPRPTAQTPAAKDVTASPTRSSRAPTSSAEPVPQVASPSNSESPAAPSPLTPPGLIPASDELSTSAALSSDPHVQTPPAAARESQGEALANLPKACRLPALVSSAPEKLLLLSNEPHEPIEIAIYSAAANVPAKAGMIAEADAERRNWTISYATDFNSNTGKVALGTIRREGLELIFAWAQPPADVELRRQLANCQLVVWHGQDSRTVQLRQILSQPQLTLDMTEDNQTVEFAITDLPRADSLRLEIRELVSFPDAASLRGSAKVVGLGKQAVIEFANRPGAEIGLRLYRPTASSGLAFRLEPVFRENKVAKYDLTLKRLEKTKVGAENALKEANQALPGARSGLESAKSARSRLESNRPAASDVQANAIWQPQYNQAILAVDRAAKRVGRLETQRIESQQRLDAVPSIRSFLESLHQKAAIRYVICAESGEQDVVLVDGTSATAAK